MKIIFLCLSFLFLGCVSSPVKQEIERKVKLMSFKPNRLLKRNMRMEYTSNGKTAPQWIVKSVGRKYKKKKSCAKTTISYDSGKTFETKEECVSNNILSEKQKGQWVKSRPVFRFMKLVKKHANGKTKAIYNTGDFEPYEIQGKEITVLDTQVVNYDSTGKIVGRLNEKYSLDLGTAVEGSFEVPSDKGWVPINKFKLVKIKR